MARQNLENRQNGRLKLFLSDVSYSSISLIFILIFTLTLIYVLVWHRHWLTSPVTLEYVRILAWPSVVILAIAVLRPFIPALIDGRDLMVKYKELSLGLVKNQEQTAALSESNPTLVSGNKDHSLKVIESQPLTPEERQSRFATAASVIFGTQITALYRLQAYGTLNSDELQDLYEQHRKLFPNTPFLSILDLMRFLVGQQFVKKVGGKYEIGLYGNEFLLYLTANGINANQKPA